MDSTEWWRVPSTDPLARILGVFKDVIISVGRKTANRPCFNLGAERGYSDILGIGHHPTC
jgi:hypothetical protein